jgi:hypothetical protein
MWNFRWTRLIYCKKTKWKPDKQTYWKPEQRRNLQKHWHKSSIYRSKVLRYTAQKFSNYIYVLPPTCPETRIGCSEWSEPDLSIRGINEQLKKVEHWQGQRWNQQRLHCIHIGLKEWLRPGLCRHVSRLFQ